MFFLLRVQEDMVMGWVLIFLVQWGMVLSEEKYNVVLMLNLDHTYLLLIKGQADSVFPRVTFLYHFN
jgi:hypothetical protein